MPGRAGPAETRNYVAVITGWTGASPVHRPQALFSVSIKFRYY
jgi:hypothetical protein